MSETRLNMGAVGFVIALIALVLGGVALVLVLLKKTSTTPNKLTLIKITSDSSDLSPVPNGYYILDQDFDTDLNITNSNGLVSIGDEFFLDSSLLKKDFVQVKFSSSDFSIAGGDNSFKIHQSEVYTFVVGDNNLVYRRGSKKKVQ